MNYQKIFMALDKGYKDLFPDYSKSERRRQINEDMGDFSTILHMMAHHLGSWRTAEIRASIDNGFADDNLDTLFEEYLKALIMDYKEDIKDKYDVL